MNIDSYWNSVNETLQVFAFQLEYCMQLVLKSSQKIGKAFSDPTFSWESPIQFSSLQWTLFKVTCILLLLTFLLISYSWKIYGKVITEKFVRPSTLKEIEELKLSVAKLKLPKEHSPRI